MLPPQDLHNSLVFRCAASMLHLPQNHTVASFNVLPPRDEIRLVIAHWKPPYVAVL